MHASLEGFPTDQALELAKLGAGWLLAFIFGWVIVYLWRDARATAKAHAAALEAQAKAFNLERAAFWEARLKTWEEVGALVREQNVVQAQLTAARETGASATNAMADAARSQTAVITRLIDAVDRAIASTEALRETILTKLAGRS
jgi:hypothetical protein